MVQHPVRKRGRIFISYRRQGGAELARLVRDNLQARGYDVFMDVEDLRSGPFNTALFKEIESSSDVVAILTPGSLDGCANENDWLRLEIVHAIKCRRNIVPVMARGFSFPQAPLPDDLKALPHFQGVEPSHDYFRASMEKLALLLVGAPRASLSKVMFIWASITTSAVAALVVWAPWDKTRTSSQTTAAPTEHSLSNPIPLDNRAITTTSNQRASPPILQAQLSSVDISTSNARLSSVSNAPGAAVVVGTTALIRELVATNEVCKTLWKFIQDAENDTGLKTDEFTFQRWQTQVQTFLRGKRLSRFNTAVSRFGRYKPEQRLASAVGCLEGIIVSIGRRCGSRSGGTEIERDKQLKSFVEEAQANTRLRTDDVAFERWWNQVVTFLESCVDDVTASQFESASGKLGFPDVRLGKALGVLDSLVINTGVPQK